MFNKLFKNQKGFTLVELLVVIAIIGVLAAVAVPQFAAQGNNARGARIQSDLQAIDTALAMQQANGGVVTIAGAIAANILPATIAPPAGTFTTPNRTGTAPAAYGQNALGRGTITVGGTAFTADTI